jgi:hypothetical protein
LKLSASFAREVLFGRAKPVKETTDGLALVEIDKIEIITPVRGGLVNLTMIGWQGKNEVFRYEFEDYAFRGDVFAFTDTFYVPVRIE